MASARVDAIMAKDPAAHGLSTEILVHILEQLETYHKTELRVLPGLAQLSRGWASAVGNFMNTGAAAAGVAPAQLSEIKRAARNLDLEFLRGEFQDQGELLLGHFDMTDYVDEDELEEAGHAKMGRVIHAMKLALELEFGIPHANAMDKLFDAVAAAYKKFLVVKAVETLAKIQPGSAAKNIWSEKCMVSVIVDVLWHCHLMRPQHYLDSCTALLGSDTPRVIDHDPGYVSKKAVKGSDLANKIEILYKYERLCANHGYAYPLKYDGDKQAFALTKTEEEWLSMAFPEECYGDEMECG